MHSQYIPVVNDDTSTVQVCSLLPIAIGIAIESVEIFNSIGEKVAMKMSSSQANKMTLDVSNFIPGIYFVKVRTVNGNSVQKLIVE